MSLALRFALLLSLVALCGSVYRAEAEGGGAESARRVKRLIGDPAPEFSLERLAGDDSGTLSELRGRVVVIEFWATYCGWCRSTHPKLAKFAREHGERVAVLGISAQGKRRLTRYLRRKKLGFTVLHDRGARVFRAYGTSSTPTLAVVDREGVVRYAGVGKPAARRALEVARGLLEAGDEPEQRP